MKNRFSFSVPEKIIRGGCGNISENRRERTRDCAETLGVFRTMSSDASPQLKAPLMPASGGGADAGGPGGGAGAGGGSDGAAVTDSITVNIHNPSRRATGWKLRYQDFLSDRKSASAAAAAPGAANGTEPTENFRSVELFFPFSAVGPCNCGVKALTGQLQRVVTLRRNFPERWYSCTSSLVAPNFGVLWTLVFVTRRSKGTKCF